MYKFYVLYKDGSTIEGKVNCTEEEFKCKFILPLNHAIYSYMFWETTENQIEELIWN